MAHSTTPLDGWASRGWGRLFPIRVPQEAKHSLLGTAAQSRPQSSPGRAVEGATGGAGAPGGGGPARAPQGGDPPPPGVQAPHSPAHPRQAAEGATARGDLCCHPAAARGGAAGAAGPCRTTHPAAGWERAGPPGTSWGKQSPPWATAHAGGQLGAEGGSQASSGQSRTPPSPGGAAVTALACGRPGSPSPGEEKASRPLPSGSPSGSYRCVWLPLERRTPHRWSVTRAQT